MAKAEVLFAVEPYGTLARNAPLMLYTRLSETLAYSAFITNPDRYRDLHNMRIAAKRLRYTMEIFAQAYEDRGADYAVILDHVKSIQEQIGEIHDCDVRLDAISSYLKSRRSKKPDNIGLELLIQKETADRHELYIKFVCFWKSLTNDQHFEEQFVEIVFSARAPGSDMVAIDKQQ
jgi:CHAD domain-containing protein